MPLERFHVYGPTQLYWGGELTANRIGQSNGRVLVSIREVMPHIEVPTDAAGGQPEDWITTLWHAVVGVTLIDWDYDVVQEVITALKVGSPFAPVGEEGTVGMLRIADVGYKSLVILGSKLTASQGGRKITFPRAFRDPDSDTEWGEIGNAPSVRTITFRCQPDTASPPKVYTIADVT